MAILDMLSGGAWTLLSFIIALSVIVTVHEFGHYIVGRWSGIKAEVFSVGFGPRLAGRRDRRGTMWQIAALPLGGYVKFKGDANAASAGASAPGAARDTLSGAPLWARFLTVAAGPVFNFVLSALIFAGFLLMRGVAVETPTVGEIAPSPPGIVNALRPGDEILGIGDQPVAAWADLFTAAETLPPAATHDWRVRRDGAEFTVTAPDPMPARVGSVAPGGAAASAGLREGDVIEAINGAPVLRFDELRAHVEAADGAPITLRIWREGGVHDITLSPRQQDLPLPDGGFEKRWLIGITAAGYFAPATESVGPAKALWRGTQQVGHIISSSLTGMWAMITGQIGACNLGGAISIAENTGQAADAGLGQFVWWIAILSVAIGFVNLLPIPVLDGGHLAFYLWEAVRGRPPSARVVGWLSRFGIALVLALMIFGLTNDIRC